MNPTCLECAASIRDLLCSQGARLVLAESCTAGRVAATFGGLPGISQWFCGGFVVYRAASKSGWLGVPPHLLEDPNVGPVSRVVTASLAQAALAHTPEARYGLAVTGDVGPAANPSTDGVVFIALCDRLTQSTQECCVRLENPPPTDAQDLAGRLARLEEATWTVLNTAKKLAFHATTAGRKNRP